MGAKRPKPKACLTKSSVLTNNISNNFSQLFPWSQPPKSPRVCQPFTRKKKKHPLNFWLPSVSLTFVQLFTLPITLYCLWFSLFWHYLGEFNAWIYLYLLNLGFWPFIFAFLLFFLGIFNLYTIFTLLTTLYCLWFWFFLVSLMLGFIYTAKPWFLAFYFCFFAFFLGGTTGRFAVVCPSAYLPCLYFLLHFIGCDFCFFWHSFGEFNAWIIYLCC